MSRPSGWERWLQFFVDRKLVVFVLLGLLAFGGLYTAPFAWELGFERKPVPVDAIPNLGENQQIVFTEWPGRSPQDVEDQVGYPLTTTLLSVAGVESVRSTSMFGFSTIYVIFEDGVEFYWARSRVQEALSALPVGMLPTGVTPALGPDATALGQVFWYTLEGHDAAGNLVGGWDLHELRTIQDWTVRYALQGVSGVAEVASVGGHTKEYQVDVDPNALAAYGVRLDDVARAVKRSNLDVGARTLEINRVEYVVRGLGFVENAADLERTVVASREHTPIRISDIGRVVVGPAARRGALDDGGAETVGGVVVVRHGENPLDVLRRLKKQIARIAPSLPKRALENGVESQVRIVPYYDRSELISETLSTLSSALFQQLLITILVILVLLRNLRSSLLIGVVPPLGILAAFCAMKWSGVDANVMALAGIAIAIGTMVDMGIVFTENIVTHLQARRDDAPTARVVARAAAEVAPAVMTSVLTTVVSFLPVFALTASEGRLFVPLAFTKSFAMLGALLVSLVVVPPLAHALLARDGSRVRGLSWFAKHAVDVALCVFGVVLLWSAPLVGATMLLVGALWSAEPYLPTPWRRRADVTGVVCTGIAATWLLTADWRPLGVGRSMGSNALLIALLFGSVFAVFLAFQRVYPRLLRWALSHKAWALAVPGGFLVLGFVAWLGGGVLVGWLPDGVRASAPIARFEHTFPGFEREFMPPFDEGTYLYMPTTMPHASFGQALEMLSMVDAAIEQVPEVERAVGKLGRANSALDPAPVSMFETVVTYRPEFGTDDDGNRVRLWREHIHSPDDIWEEVVRAAKVPGVTSAPRLMPIETRLVMLSSGMRSPLGLKVFGPNLQAIERFSQQAESVLKDVPVIRRASVAAERVVGKPYLEIDIDRDAIGRYGLTIAAVQDVIEVALGGKTLSYSVEGRERYAIRVRYLREQRDSVEAVMRVLVPAPGGEQIPLEQLADIKYVRGPQAIKSEDTQLVGYVTFDMVDGAAEVDVVESAAAYLEEDIRTGRLAVPAGVHYKFAGTYENQLRSERYLRVLVPIALALVLLLLYLQFRRVSTSLIIFSGVAVAVAGGFWLVWCYGQPWFLNLSLFDINVRELFHIETVNMSVAVWVGFVALVGIATDAGVVMATHLSQCFGRTKPLSVEGVREATMQAAERRLRPCLMTTATTMLALLPILSTNGRGADVMLPMAIPGVGGMVAILATLVTVPVLYALVEERRLPPSENPDS